MSPLQQLPAFDAASGRAYLEAVGLLAVIETAGYGEAYPPYHDDLARLHKLIRDLRIFTVLEFGTGWSTLAIAHALELNRRDWEAIEEAARPKLRIANPFVVYVCEAEQKWADLSLSRLAPELRRRVDVNVSPVEIGQWRGEICHYFERLPDCTPGFVYLDGPNPEQVQGELRGFRFDTNRERLIMSADLLQIENQLTPGCRILVDGRTANARWLQRSFSRKWRHFEDRMQDVSLFVLEEPALGSLSENQLRWIGDL